MADNNDEVAYNHDDYYKLKDKFDLLMRAIAEDMGRQRPAQTSPESISSTRKNRLLPYLKMNQPHDSVPLDEFIMQAAIALRDEFADCYITMQEGNNNLIIELSNHEFFQVQITKLNAEDMKE